MYFFSLDDLIFLMSCSPFIVVSNRETPTEVASDLESVVACNQLNIHRYKCLVYSGENALYFFQ